MTIWYFAAFDIHAAADEEELPTVQMSRKILPNAEIITTIIPFDQKLQCRTKGEFCQLVPLAMACCNGLKCTNIFGGHCIPFSAIGS
jgi:hypothetical protein